LLITRIERVASQNERQMEGDGKGGVYSRKTNRQTEVELTTDSFTERLPKRLPTAGTKKVRRKKKAFKENRDGCSKESRRRRFLSHTASKKQKCTLEKNPYRRSRRPCRENPASRHPPVAGGVGEG